MMTDLIMYDAITKFVADMPTNGDIYAGYDDGSYNDVQAIIDRFPTKPVVSIDVLANNQAQALDVETGDATVASIDPWLVNFALTGPVFDLPVVYMSVDLARASFPSAHPNGCLLWSAHYTMQAHICGPSSCGALPYDADMTQWGSFADYDESLVSSVHYIWKDPPPMGTQTGWKYCSNCKVLFYGPNNGPCVAKPSVSVTDLGAVITFGAHDGGTSDNYVLTTE